jgi:hypothetical protein
MTIKELIYFILSIFLWSICLGIVAIYYIAFVFWQLITGFKKSKNNANNN